MNGVVLAKAPLRISLGGGGTDLPSYYERHGGFVVAGTINKYVYVMAHHSFEGRYRLKYSAFEDVAAPADIVHPIFREVLVRNNDPVPVEVTTIADVPAGTGMGSSGAFTVCLLNACSLLQEAPTNSRDLAEAAFHIEAGVLGSPVGKQDPFTAATGGVCGYSFNQDGSTRINQVAIPPDARISLRDNLLAFYTGITRNANVLLGAQRKSLDEHDRKMVDNLHRTKELGMASAGLLADGDIEGWARLTHEHWLNKRERSPGMSSRYIDDLYTLARRSGAIGGKLIGAGGGGYLLVYTGQPDNTRKAMRAAGAQELRFDFQPQGCTAEILGG